MTRFVYDQFSKDYLEELLKPFGEVIPGKYLPGAILEIDVWFRPSAEQSANVDTLGLLGKFTSTPALFEAFRNPASEDEICKCLEKVLKMRNIFIGEAEDNKIPINRSNLPRLWIITPTASKRILSDLTGIEKADWLPGVYFLTKTLRTALVVVHKLPSTPETLWLRILGRGKIQRKAIDELEALPPDHPFQKMALRLLYNLQQNLRINQNLEPDDQELIMRLAPLYEQDRARAVQEGEQLGLQKGERRLILRLINRRFGEINPVLIEQVQGLSVERLEELGEALLDFRGIADLEAWLQSQS